jgi:hypothetical protein
VKEIVEASLGGLSYGKGLAIGASTTILVITVFAALDQLNIAENVVTGLFYALLAIVVGSAVVAVGGGGIKTMQRYWERTADRAERESSNVRDEMDGAGDRIRDRVQTRTEQAGVGNGESTQPQPTGVTGSAQPRSNQPGSPPRP